MSPETALNIAIVLGIIATVGTWFINHKLSEFLSS